MRVKPEEWQAREGAESLTRARREDLAIVGIGCRIPGASTAEEWWTLLTNGTDAVGQYPFGRDPVLDELYRNGVRDGRIATVSGGFLEGIDLFDAGFFGIAPREAACMDPQHRMLLEVAWEAFEEAGIPRAAFSGTRSGVFVGQWLSDYETCLYRRSRDQEFYATIGTGRYAAAGRLSFHFDLRGPALTIDTACSSSLVAVHLACRSLWDGECDMALAGGANVILRPEITQIYSRAKMLSPGGRCRFGDDSADGYVRSEGAVVVVLKRYSNALAADDHIHALIRGTAMNNDGASNGLLVMPSQDGQKALLRAALADAGVGAGEVAYVEAHGTGTAVGDPIELEAIGAVLGVGRERPCAVGSLKSNVGHTESAAGVAGLVKVALSLEKGAIPPSLHCRVPNARVNWSALGIRVQTEAGAWPPAAQPVAGVTSLGITGTNAHVVLQAPPSQTSAPSRASSPFLLPISGLTREALRGQAESWLGYCRALTDLYSLGWTAGVRRTHFAHRLAIAAKDQNELLERLEARLAELRDSAAPAESLPAPRVVFVCPGQGSQWLGMSRSLLETEGIFRQRMQEVDAVCRPYLGDSLIRLLEEGDEDELRRIDIIQPALFGIQVSLAALWTWWGVAPDAVVGHSMGEVAAACIAGLLTLEDAARVICERSRLLRTRSGRGAMALVDLTAAETEECLAGYERSLSVAVSNSPRSTVISGDPAALDEVMAGLERRGVFCRRVRVDVASHSPQVDELETGLLEALQTLRPQPAQLPMYSTVTGERLNGEGCDAAYWFRNLRQTVCFGSVVATLMSSGHDVFIELSPHPLLLPAVQETFEAGGRGCLALPSGRRNEAERGVLLQSLGAAYERGLDIRWDRLYPDPGEVLPLPRYCWQRERFWFEDVDASEGGEAAPAGTWRHVEAATGEHLFEMVLGLLSTPMLADHEVRGTVVVPAAFWLDSAERASRKVLSTPGVRFENCRFLRALTLRDNDRVHVQLILKRNPGVWNFSVFAANQDEPGSWTLHASGIVQGLARLDSEPAASGPEADIQDAEQFYERVSRLGISYGPAFRPIEQFCRKGVKAKVWLQSKSGQAALTEVIDGALQSFLLFAPDGTTCVPSSIEQLEYDGSAMDGTALVAQAEADDQTELRGNLLVSDACGNVRMRARGVQFKPMAGLAGAEHANCLYRPEWVAAPVGQSGGARSTWILLAEPGPLTESLAAVIRAQGDAVIAVRPGSEYRSLGEQEFQIPVDDAASYSLVLNRLQARGRQIAGVVHLLSAERTSEHGEEFEARGALTLAPAVQALDRCGSQPMPRLFLVTRGTQPAGASPVSNLHGAGLWGAGAVVANEHPGLRCKRIDLAPASFAGEFTALWKELSSGDDESAVAVREEGRFVLRLRRHALTGAVPRQSKAAENYRIVQTGAGVLDEIGLEAAERRAPCADEVEVEVDSAGLNFIDVLKAMDLNPTGDSPGPVTLGGEFAGVVRSVGRNAGSWKVGDEVVGFTPSFRRVSCFARFISLPADCLVSKPAGLTFEQAATLPLTFITAWQALFGIAQLKRGERVLIHSAAGGVGLAAVQLAKRAGAEIYATAGTEEKRSMLRAMGVMAVFDSRTLDFAEGVRAAGGVDVVLNSLIGEAFQRSMTLLRRYGRFVEIGKRVLTRENILDLELFRENLSFAVLDVAAMVESRREEVRRILAETVAKVNAGELEPLPFKVFSAGRAADAFREMAQGNHTGKIVLAFGSERVGNIRPRPESMLNSDGTYLISGGTGGLGKVAAAELAGLGAKHLVLLSRTGKTAELAPALAQIEVRCVAADVTDRAAMAQVLAEVRATMPPLRGVIHAAGVLADRVLLEADRSRFEEALAPKIRGAWNLHELTCPDPLEFFVLFSSVSALLGTTGQANYAAGNSFLDALAEYRRARELPAVSVSWGPWAEVGLAAAESNRGERLASQGLGSLSPAAGAAIFSRILTSAAAHIVAVDLDAGRWAEAYPGQHLLDGLITAQQPAKEESLPRLLAALPDRHARAALLETHLREQIGRVLRLAPQRVPLDRPLKTLGVDSLMAVEFRNRLERSLELRLPATLVWNYPSVTALVAHLASRLGLDAGTAPAPPPPQDEADDLSAALSAEIFAAERLLGRP